MSSLILVGLTGAVPGQSNRWFRIWTRPLHIGIVELFLHSMRETSSKLLRKLLSRGAARLPTILGGWCVETGVGIVSLVTSLIHFICSAYWELLSEWHIGGRQWQRWSTNTLLYGKTSTHPMFDLEVSLETLKINAIQSTSIDSVRISPFLLSTQWLRPRSSQPSCPQPHPELRTLNQHWIPPLYHLSFHPSHSTHLSIPFKCPSTHRPQNKPPPAVSPVLHPAILLARIPPEDVQSPISANHPNTMKSYLIHLPFPQPPSIHPSILPVGSLGLSDRTWGIGTNTSYLTPVHEGLSIAEYRKFWRAYQGEKGSWYWMSLL